MSRDMHTPSEASLAAGIVRHRRWIAAAWVIVALLLLPRAREAATRLAVAARVTGSESDAVAMTPAQQSDA